ncbi:chemotaxis protein CheX [Colwellia sp. RSH04]|uniref:chemotaxis protein CheX n=1 Tax=Colwellia sp. RSH04 TaxID=2305464 RepID=UPI000E57CF9B|nr:chemotaxis protein CheX [Colwellia sp. RSH04]RHW74820.1 chemotaxis protein CheX [Colwellia sp. RSH04]
MNVEFINPFLSSMLNVMSTMAQMELTPEKPKLKKGQVAMGDVSGLIGMVSEQAKGSLSITYDASLAIATMKGMVGEAPDSVNEEITDLVGEITNMVTGGAKRMLSEKGIEFDMATPVVVSGHEHTIHHKAKGPIVIIPLSSPHGKAYIEFSFDES